MFMKKSAFSLICGSVLSVFISLHLFCVGFDSPTTPGKTKATVIFKASTQKIYEGALVDSVRKEIWIGAALYLPVNFDSVWVQVLDEGSSVIDTVFRTFKSEYYFDTLWVKHTFLKPGTKNVMVTPFSTPERPATGATITIQGIEEIPEDKTPPALSLVTPSDTNAVISTDTFTIDLLCSDSSGVASVTASMGSKTFQSSLNNGHYTIPVTGFTRGEINVVTITAKDSSVSGNPVSQKLYFNYQTTGFSVKYQKGSDVSGELPFDTRKYQNDEQAIVLGNTGNLVKSGFIFSGWNTKEDGSGTSYAGGSTFKMGNTDVVLFAQWTKSATFSVIYNGNGNTSGIVPVDANMYETTATVTVKGNTGSLTKTGVTFAGWSTKADGSGKSYDAGSTLVMGSTNDTLFAKWTLKQTHTLTVTATNGSVTKAPDCVTCDSGTVVTLTPVPATGYHFTGWSGALTGSANPATVTMNSAKSVTAEFAKNQVNSFALAVLATNGTVRKTPDLPQYDSGYTVGLKAIPGEGFSFANWSGDATGTTDSTTVVMSAAKSITANFAPVTYQLTVSAGTGGTITVPSSSPATVNHGAATTITASPNSGYRFSGWSVSSGTAIFGDTSSVSTTVTLSSGNATVSAGFTRITFQLSVTTETGGTISAPSSPATVNHGAATIITALPGAGYSFNGWIVTSGSAAIPDLSSATTTATLTSGNAEIKAQWTAIPYSVTYTLNGGLQNGGSYPATYTVATSAITLPSPTKTPYVFDGWYDNSELTGSKMTTIPKGTTGNKTLYAKWAIKDRDGNYYTEVKIGNQYWMVENFRCTVYNDSTPIPHITGDEDWAGLTSGAYCFYDNSTNTAFRKKYGALYNGYAVATGKIAPEGWRIPTDDDWVALQDYLITHGYNYDGSTDSNKIAKSLAAKSDWTVSTYDGTIGNDLNKNNRSGFSALPSGRRNGSFEYFGELLQFCNPESRALEFGRSNALWNVGNDLNWSWYGPLGGCSVRLVRN
jgi:uncharacterized protein (TIGR02145 family)/uncharacterized repeat protein (TIGR02543 family)